MAELTELNVMGHQDRLVLNASQIEYQLGGVRFQSQWDVLKYSHHVQVWKVQEIQTQNQWD